MRDHILERLRRSERLFADETTAPVLDQGAGRTKTGQLWAYARDDRPWGGNDPPMVAYVYAADRKSERAEAHPGDFAGILQVDGYGGYAALAKRRQQIQLAFCWSQVRRKFFELADKSPVATEVLRRIAMFYAIEDEVRGSMAEQRRALRVERSRIVIYDLRLYLDARLRQVSAKSKLAEAIRYALSRWDGLTGAAGNKDPRHSRRSGEISFNASRVPALAAQTASMPVPADGSSTSSPGTRPQVRAASQAIRGGVANCCHSICSSLRLVWPGTRVSNRVNA